MASIMIQGTTSSAGKSLLCTGLCRIFLQDGYRPYPFKSQNMSSRYSLTKDGRRFSTAQALQAQAANLEPEVAMNPILLIPQSHTGSEVYWMGEKHADMDARTYFEYKPTLRPLIQTVYDDLEARYDPIVIEGAGSPAEINLKEHDIVNMGMAKMADAPVLLIADIDRGGVFASLYGTVMLLDPEERQRIKGLIINRFRGDKSLLSRGIAMIEELVGIPVIGVIPYTTIRLEEEDSITDSARTDATIARTHREIEREINAFAHVLREHMDIPQVYRIMEEHEQEKRLRLREDNGTC